MSSHELELLDTLTGWSQPLSVAVWSGYDVADPVWFDRMRHALTMQIREGYVALLRGSELETAVPVAAWEVRGIVADPANWVPPDPEPPRFWLEITDRGMAYFYDPE